jgi:SAM-dependent methyltransferase
MQRPDWAPESIDVERPSVARMYDFFLGGSHNFAIDREAVRQVLAVAPEAALVAQANRAFLRRAVRFLVDSGVRQFLDIGSGIPTVGNVHEIAQRLDPQARVMYVDTDPVAVAHSRQMLGGDERTGIIQEDLRQPERIVHHPDVRKLLDFDQPIAVMIVAVLHFLPDQDDPAGILATVRDALAPGSCLVLSQASVEGRDEQVDGVGSVYRKAGSELHFRTRDQIARIFDGFDLVPPGLVWLPQWRPEERPDGADQAYRAEQTVICGVGQLRA